MDKIKFVMTNTSDIVTEVCREALEAKGVTVMVCDKNGTAALETLLAVHPQACLLDAFMPDLDAITVKQRYEEKNSSGVHTTFFVTGAFQSEEVEQDLLDNGFSFFFVKPFDENVLVSRVLRAAGGASARSRSRWIPMSLPSPRSCTRSACRPTSRLSVFARRGEDGDGGSRCDQPHHQGTVSRHRRKFDTTASKVERAMRHAIDVAWSRGRLDAVNSMYGYKVLSPDDKPTNGEFVALIADKVSAKKSA